MDRSPPTRRLPVGAEVAPEGPGAGVHFRVLAPRRRRVDVAIEGGAAHALSAEGDGYFSGRVAAAAPGTRYRYRLDGGDAFPDPASRFQPDGPHGPSQVVDPARYRWSAADARWPGVRLRGQVVYEMHIGTFTREGTFAAAARELPELARAGFTLLEIMPLADFPGRFGWGYDGVNLFAPTRLYGEPDDLRRLVDRAHEVGLGAILDVVYNHLGPDGNYLAQYSADYYSTRYKGEWGDPLNFDGDRSAGTRELVLANAQYWIEEFHFDGYRLDATQGIFDASEEPIIAALGRRAREAARGRAVVIVAENEPQEAKQARPVERGGYGLDGLWNDDFHHAARVALTRRNEAYFTDYGGTPQEIVSALRLGFLFQGQRYKWQKKPRGTPALDLAPEQLVIFLQNHDQIANGAAGARVHALAAPGCARAMTAVLLLAPGTPLVFQGQEFAASSPFLFFADHNPDLARAVRKGRAELLRQFPSAAAPEMADRLADPADPATFERCKLDLAERERPGHEESYELHKALLRLRRDDPAFRAQRRPEGAVIGPEAFVLRFSGDAGAGGPAIPASASDRLLVVNLGRDLALDSAPEPLLAPPEGARWTVLLSTEDPRHGGSGTPSILADDGGFRFPGAAAVVLGARPAAREPEGRS